MGICTDIVARGRGRAALLVSCLALIAGLTATAGNSALAQQPASSCSPAVARLVSLQGNVELQRADSENWVPVTRLDTALCAGDRLRTDALSRAALFVQPETLVRVDQNTTITLNQSTDEIQVEFFAAELAEKARNAQSCGAGYFITRFPKKFKVTTPHMNAAVEGTEFMVESSCDATKLTVLEGKVASESVATRDKQLVTAGQSVASGATGTGAITTVVKPADAVQWVLRYPPISDQADVGGLSNAEELLRAGSVDEALAEIDAELSVNPTNTDAHALRAVIQVAKNDKASALESARKAAELGTSNYRAWLALSYAQQAGFDLEAALESARKAEALRADSSLAHARVAELLLSLGDARRAEEAARAAMAANPAESHAYAMLGFVHLVQVNTKAARAEFSKAIDLDSFSALPRFGIGLAMIRDGQLVQGREQIEIAVALDPSNSLLRSYVGKAYFEENSVERNQLAAEQFALARQFDTQDPTPWFYDAILQDSNSNAVAALRDLQRSIELNGNRGVYRSRLLLDEDLAARGAQLARNYQELGFEQLAQNEAYRALNTSNDDYSAHRLLADSLLNRPRHEIARVSELLQSQIRQPLNLTPVDTQLFDDQSFVLRDAGPSTIGFGEFGSLYVQNGLSAEASGLIGGNNTIGDQVVVSGIHDRVSGSVGQYYYDSDGFQDGWGLRKEIQNAYVQWQFSPQGSLFGELRHSDQVQGDLSQNFFGVTDPQRLTQDRELYRFGLGMPLGGWTFAAAITRQNAEDSTEVPPGSLLFSSDVDESNIEVTGSYESPRFNLQFGAGYYELDGVTQFFGTPFGSEGSATNAFVYGDIKAISNVLLIEVGASWDEVDRADIFGKSLDQLSPKFGIYFAPRPGTTLRAAAIRGFRRSFVAEQTLERTQVAGFNQFYDDALGTTSDRYGVGWDEELSESSFAGIELSRRVLKVPQPFALPIERFEWNEKDYRAYYSLVPNDSLSLSLEYTYERITQDPFFAENFLDVETQMIPASVTWFPRGRQLSVQTRLGYVRQTGEFRRDPLSAEFEAGTSEFWMADISLRYQLSSRRGFIMAEIRNVFDEQFNYQETDTLSPTMARERLAFLRASFSF